MNFFCFCSSTLPPPKMITLEIKKFHRYTIKTVRGDHCIYSFNDINVAGLKKLIQMKYKIPINRQYIVVNEVTQEDTFKIEKTDNIHLLANSKYLYRVEPYRSRNR
jgi:hypothetical protein